MPIIKQRLIVTYQVIGYLDCVIKKLWINYYFFRKEYSVQLDNTFEIKSDQDVLKKLGLAHGLGEVKENIAESDEIKNIISMVPEAFQPYVVQLIQKDKLEPICFDHSQFPNL